jgi:CheY-like chemotaxis protein
MGMIEEVVLTLASNARDAMPQGGQLTIATKAVNLDEACIRRSGEARPGRFVCLTVTDTGCGMDEAALDHLFEPFFTTKPSGKGSGLGLAAVYGIVKQHLGWVEVKSRPGQGSTFNIFLPASSKSLAPKTSLEGKPALRGGSETILLVEDEPAVLTLARGILQRLGYQVFPAPSGDDAAAVWQEHREKVDLLLTDMVLPGNLNGQALAEQLRREKPGLKVLYTSGYSIDVVAPGLSARRDFVFLQKPYHPEALAQTVRICLDGALP